MEEALPGVQVTNEPFWSECDMSHYGKRKYVCLDCGDFVYVHPHQRAQRCCKARCPSCGSTCLEESSAGALEQSAEIVARLDSRLKQPKYRIVVGDAATRDAGRD